MARGDPDGARDPDAVVRVRLEAEPAHLNPLLGDALAARVALGDVYEGLLCAGGARAPPRPCLAESVAVSAGGKIWTFSLRRGVKWHDGEKLEGDDVVFTLNLLRGRRRVPTLLAADFDDLASVSSRGRRVTVTFAGFRMGRREAFARLPILPRHLFEKAPPAGLAGAPPSRSPIGTGPLRFVSWKPGESIELARHQGYWGQEAGAARVLYRVLPSRTRALAELAAGRLDLAVGLPVDEAQPVAAEHAALELFSYPRPAYLAAVHNTRKSPLDEPGARRALTMLLDRAAIAREVFRGHGEVVSGPYPPGDPAEDPKVEPLPFDPGAAGRALSAGDARPELTLLCPSGSRTMARIADIWAADAGPHVDIAIERLPYADLLARAREGKFEVALLAFTTGRDVDLYHRFHSSQVGAENYGALRDPSLDRLLEAARSEPDPTARRQKRRAIHRRLHELQPYTFIASDVRVGLVRGDVGGVRSGPHGPAARALWKAKQ